MKQHSSNKFINFLIALFLFAVISVMMFFGYVPTTYNYIVGSVAEDDIYASRNVVDIYQTEYNAVVAKNSVNQVFIISDEISEENIDDVTSFFNIIRQSRNQLVTPMGTPVENLSEVEEELASTVRTTFGIDFDAEDSRFFFNLSLSTFNIFEDRAVSVTEVLMMKGVDAESLETSLNETIEEYVDSTASFAVYKDELCSYLNRIIEPNLTFDSVATAEAGEIAYNNAKSEPVIVERGTKIVAAGEVVSEHSYQLLEDLELLSDSFSSVVIYLRIAVYTLVLMVAFVIFCSNLKNVIFSSVRMFWSMLVLFLIPIFISIYASEFSVSAVFVLFFTTICSTYFGAFDGVVLSVFELFFMWPSYSFDVESLFITFVGVIVCSSLAARSKVKNNSAYIIIFSTLSVFLSALAFNFLTNGSSADYSDSLIWSSVSSLISVVSAIGLMPVFELISNAVSPVRLIELSQLGHPLLKQLSLEASGTTQHCYNVANLSDAAAEAIGCDALLCRVASYYHDIGKLQNPLYFTENQVDVNPHSELTPEESTAIITAHTDDGIKLAKKYRLPQSIIDIIGEHHGNMYPYYFYKKACDMADKEGREHPSVDSFRYRGRIPQTRESAIIMLADTCEAAIKSLNTKDIELTESKIRQLVKGKIDSDQLIESGLSLEDIEKIIRAFLNVYSGMYHERIKYPE